MKNNTKIFLFKCICLLFLFASNANGISGQCDNLIKNPSFENPASSQYPDFIAQVKYLDAWEDDMDKKNQKGKPFYLHSPDWYKDPSFTLKEANQDNTKQSFAKANTGNGFVGMLDAELIQQKITLCPMIEGNYYTLDMFIKPVISTFDSHVGGPLNWSGGAVLRVWLAENKIKYKNNKIEDDCTNENNYFTTPHTDKIEILNKTISPSDFQENSPNYIGGIFRWKKISNTFQAPNNKYNWLVIEIVDNNSDNDNCTSYVLIDDVYLRPGCPSCTVSCSQTDGSIVPQNPMRSVTQLEMFRISNLNNATSAKLIISTDILGQAILYSKSYYCTNGINQDITWNGRNNNGAVLSAANYFWKLEVKNDCGYTCSFNGIVTVLGVPNQNVDAVNCYTGPDKIPEPCCQENPLISILSGDINSTESIYRYGYDGVNLAGDPAKKLTVLSTAKTSIKSGKNINIGVGFSTNIGAEFELTIEECRK